MTEWHTDPHTGLRVGLALIAALVLIDAGLVAWAITAPVTFATFVAGLLVLLSVAAMGWIAYRLTGLIRSAYVLDRNALVIVWGETEQVIPTPSDRAGSPGGGDTGTSALSGDPLARLLGRIRGD